MPRGSGVEGWLRENTPDWVLDGEAVVEAGPVDASGELEAPDVGDVVMSVPAPETLERESDEVLRVIGRAGPGAEPLVVVVEAAEELRDEEVAPLLQAATRAARPVILRVIRDA